jgi:hypothetical protein
LNDSALRARLERFDAQMRRDPPSEAGTDIDRTGGNVTRRPT